MDNADYAPILAELKNGDLTYDFKFNLAVKAFGHTAAYDALIAQYLSREKFPEKITLTFEKAQDLRYGENPHQDAVFYKEPLTSPSDLVNAKQLHGKELSFNNINDTHGALELLKEFNEPAIVAVKHATPCGVGIGATLFEAWKKTFDADPKSIFGGIIAANREVCEKIAADIKDKKVFLEIIIAPSFSDKALEILQEGKNLRLLTLDVKAPQAAYAPTPFDFKKVSGGLLIQDTDNTLFDDLTCATDRKPTDAELNDLKFAWKLVKHIKSNGIAIAKNGQSLGLAGGQTNRIWAAGQAIDHAGEFLGADMLKGAALASDAFFPFPDCVEAAAKAGITAIIQPGGSQNDNLSIEACNKYGIAMMLTGVRHFRH